MKITDLYRYWRFLQNKPFGRWIFNRIIRFINPYTGALKANICALDKGFARIELRDRRGIRNHLNSIHAIALTNLAEYTSGLALITLFSENIRGIPVEIKIEFLKKARGVLIAECRTQLADLSIAQAVEHIVRAEIRDADNDLVARAEVSWKLSVIESG
ncbi:hypothetical protein MNBD_GAMMA10-1013 [hydrothermal vent metagenome]|uniref:DUF4442 domain-containing protein n=1 Tax=hydrothermal vent metagenome TaxID=652676 RepID=A0A3B0XMV6_9ZZZZ